MLFPYTFISISVTKFGLLLLSDNTNLNLLYQQNFLEHLWSFKFLVNFLKHYRILERRKCYGAPYKLDN
jgi:hypothetical protein